jgi:hypothetical protein
MIALTKTELSDDLDWQVDFVWKGETRVTQTIAATFVSP